MNTNLPVKPALIKEITVSETLSKAVQIVTQDYLFFEGEQISIDISNTDWLKEYLSDNYSISELLTEIPNFLKSIYPLLDRKNKAKAKHWIEACKGWNQDEIEAVI